MLHLQNIKWKYITQNYSNSIIILFQSMAHLLLWMIFSHSTKFMSGFINLSELTFGYVMPMSHAQTDSIFMLINILFHSQNKWSLNTRELVYNIYYSGQYPLIRRLMGQRCSGRVLPTMGLNFNNENGHKYCIEFKSNISNEFICRGDTDLFLFNLTLRKIQIGLYKIFCC